MVGNFALRLLNLGVSSSKRDRTETTMHLHWFLVFLSITFANGVNQAKVETAELRAVNFAKEIRGRKLNGSVITEKDVDTEFACQIECVHKSRCLSYNFGPSKDEKKFKCQLSDSDRFVGFQNFTKDDKVVYRGIKVMHPCLFNEIKAILAKVTLDYTEKRFTCLSAYAFCK